MNFILTVFFDTVTILTKDKTQNIYKNALRNGVNLRLVDENMLSVAFDERKNVEKTNELLKIFNSAESINETGKVVLSNLPKNLERLSKYLTHPVFNSYHSETKMIRLSANTLFSSL